MKRKVIEIAGSTFMVSLPRAWAVKQGVRKGEEIDVREDGAKVIITREPKNEVLRTTVDITGLDRALVKYKIYSAYILGYDEIKIVFHTPTTLYLRTRKEPDVVNTASLVEEVSHEMIGFEVIDHRSNYFILKDLGGYTQAEFNDVLKRAFRLAEDLAEDTLRAVKDMDIDTLTNIRETRPKNIKKFIYYSLRFLNKLGTKDFRKTPSYYHLMIEIKEIVGVYRFIARENVHYHKKLHPKTLSVFERVNALFASYIEAFFKGDEKRLLEIQKERMGIYQSVNQLSEQLTRHDILLLSRLVVVLNSINHLVEILVVLQYEDDAKPSPKKQS
ncbi:MAG: hypothetical protein V1735_04465 [Nanoarchaeota archaeon]